MRAARQHGPDRAVATQGHGLTAAHFVHTLAVEGVVHHVDLTLEVPSPGRSNEEYRLVVEVLTGLLGGHLPARWQPAEAVLKGTGRTELTDGDRAALGAAADRFPLFGCRRPVAW